MTRKCAMAYHGVSVNQDGTLDPCCQFTNNPDFARIPWSNWEYFRTHVLQPIHDVTQQGQDHPGCQKCTQEESAGLTTLRQFANSWYGLDPAKTPWTMGPNDVVIEDPIYHVELRLGNFCNLKCMMCTPGSSSLIQTERLRHRWLFGQVDLYPIDDYRPEHYWEDPRFYEFVERKLFAHVRRVNITGGEPFIVPEVPQILDLLLPKKNQVNISFNTNLTVLTEKILSRLEQFDHLDIVISLEGTGAHNDYIRYPSVWQDIEQNLAVLRQRVPQAHIGVNHTLQHTSVYALPDLVRWCNEKQISYYMTMVQGFDFLTFDSVEPKDLAEFRHWVTATKELESDKQQFLLNVIDQARFDIRLNDRFVRYTEILDQVRKTKYNQVFNRS